MSDNHFETLINTVDGWAPTTTLVRHTPTGDCWLISIIELNAILSRLFRSQVGVVYDSSVIAPPPVEIYQASVTITPRSTWVPDDDNPAGPPPEGVDVTQDDTTITWTVDGVRWGGMHRADTGAVRYDIVPVDANNDPLDGLTPWAVLPAGTTFQQALDHIISHHVDS